ncbi:hypothetical protein D9619_006026 [Psilocybe cf. subviscida]|uniref:Uncharacterized protein n=1 Tax=Psilocybe cf. subviscida TaxID=2480587 RepID=A0A8H5FBN0_9AGAR|nr:hypothetical protein D9619_006026 [Psilocybe cf. subviscida]
MQGYQELREFLVKEGLLGGLLYPGVPSVFPTTLTMPLRALGDPFVVDLSAAAFQIDLVTDAHTTTSRITFKFLFQNRNNPTRPLFSGRAVVRLEEYAGPPPGDNPDGPLVAVRFLEMLTPVKRLLDDDCVQLPQQGKLLYRWDKTGGYVPWGFNPRSNRKFWIDWVARSRAKMM